MVAVLFSGCSNEEVYRLVKVQSYDGAVTVQREEKLNAFEGLQLVSEDNVAVGDASFLELLADSDKHIAAEENTGFVLHSTGDENSGDITIDLLYGKSLFTIDSKLNEGSTFAVKTPNATLSVRGTSFSVAYDEETKTTDVEVYSGTVQLNSGDEELLIEKDGIATIISTDESVKIITNSTAGNPNAIALPENTEKLFAIAMTYPQKDKYSALNAEYKAKASDYTAKETGISDDDIVFQKFIGLIKNHNEEISKFFEENKANAVANTNKLLDVTDWFKKKIAVGDNEFRIDKAIMDMSIYGSNINKKYVTSDTYKVNQDGIDMYFCANGVEISFYGGFEKSAVVTTATTTTATTTAPETTVPETTTVETTTTAAATTTTVTTVPVTTTTTKATTKKDTVKIPEGSNNLLYSRVLYSVDTNSYYLYDKDILTYILNSDGSIARVVTETGGTYYDSFSGNCVYYTYVNDSYGKVQNPEWDFHSESRFPFDDMKTFSVNIHKFSDKHEDEIIRMYKEHEKDGFITALKNGITHTIGDKVYYYCREEFDVTDWFPDTFKYELGGGTYKLEFDKVVARFSINFIRYDDIIVHKDNEYIMTHPETGDSIVLNGFDVRYDFYGSGKKIK